MPKVKKDKIRENRIIDEIIVDAYDAEEQSTGWYYYLEDTIDFPFTAKCIEKRAISPLIPGDEVEPYGLGPVEECRYEIFVMIPWEKDGLAVPLSQLKVTHGGNDTKEAVLDWHYWINRGYSLE